MYVALWRRQNEKRAIGNSPIYRIVLCIAPMPNHALFKECNSRVYYLNYFYVLKTYHRGAKESSIHDYFETIHHKPCSSVKLKSSQNSYGFLNVKVSWGGLSILTLTSATKNSKPYWCDERQRRSPRHVPHVVRSTTMTREGTGWNIYTTPTPAFALTLKWSHLAVCLGVSLIVNFINLRY